MPKQILKIDQFHGGLNNSADPRDIADNELADAEDIALDSIGRITQQGDWTTHDGHQVPAGTRTPGKGLFMFSADRTGAQTNAQHANSLSDAHNGSSGEAVALTDTDASWAVNSLAGATLTNTTDSSSGTIQSNTATTATVDDLTGGTDDDWDSGDSYLISDFPETGDDYIVLADTDGDGHFEMYSRRTDSWKQTFIDYGSAADGEPVMHAVDGALRICDGNLGSANTAQWYGYIKRTNFNDASNGKRILDGWYSAPQELFTPTRGKFEVAAGSQPGQSSTTPHNDDDNAANDGSISLSINHDDGSVSGATDGGWTGYKSYYYSFIYDGVQESQLFQLLDKSDGAKYDTNHARAKKIFKLYINPGDVNFDGAAVPGFNVRCTGARVYWKSVDDSGVAYGDAYLLLDCDWVTGVKSALSGDTVAWTNESSNTVTMASTISFTDEPRTQTYRSLTGISEDCISIAATYRTSVVANRRTYIGNIYAKSKASPDAATIQADAMIKSPVNQFDSFPTDRIIEAAIRDGDEIIHLEAFADRILQFKRRTLYIINISQDIEFLEDELKHKGVNSPASVCKTDFGVAWANKHGVFLYNGETVSNLLEKEGRRIIGESAWKTFVSDSITDPYLIYPMVGYVPNKRQLIVVDNASSYRTGAGYIFDFATGAWVKGSAPFVNDVIKTNFINDYNGDLVHCESGANSTNMKKWSSDPDIQLISLKTKDYDFGHPAIRKKIYKVYISYKGNGASVGCRYALNGDSATVANFYKTSATGASTGATDSATPFHSSSVGTDDWVRAELVPVAGILGKNSNVYSFQVQLSGAPGTDFEINEMTIVYKLLGVR
jgi:hypothetical protein